MARCSGRARTGVCNFLWCLEQDLSISATSSRMLTSLLLLLLLSWLLVLLMVLMLLMLMLLLMLLLLLSLCHDAWSQLFPCLHFTIANIARSNGYVLPRCLNY